MTARARPPAITSVPISLSLRARSMIVVPRLSWLDADEDGERRTAPGHVNPEACAREQALLHGKRQIGILVCPRSIHAPGSRRAAARRRHVCDPHPELMLESAIRRR